MTKLELSVHARDLTVVGYGGRTASILGCRDMYDANRPVHMSVILANLHEFQTFEKAVGELLAKQQRKLERGSMTPPDFCTIDLVFSAPFIDAFGLHSDRKPLSGVFASPMRALHCCGELQMACFTHIELANNGMLHITACEYAREHRNGFLQEEFGFWLLNRHIEKSVIATTMTGEVVFWNDFATRLYQYTAEEAIGKNIMELTPSDMTMEQGMQIMSALNKGDHWSGMFQVKRKDGTMFMAHVTDTPIMDAGNSLKFIVGVSDDYSQLHNVMDELERLNANLEREVQSRTQELLEREANLRLVGAAIKSSDNAVLITDEDHRIMWNNDAAVQLLQQEHLVGALPWQLQIWQDVQHSSAQTIVQLLQEWLTRDGMDDDRVASDTLEVADFLSIEALTVTIQRLNGAESDNGSNKHMITFRNMTAQKKAAEAQLAAEKNLAASDTKTEMMQMLSHELRTPLQGIVGVSSTMLVDLEPEETNLFDGISTILASARLLLTLISNVLDLRKVELNMMQEVELGAVPIGECIQDSMRFCDPYACVNEVKLIKHGLDADPLMVTGNRLRLEQVMVNLLTNSIKYTNTGTKVIVSMRQASVVNALNEARHATASDLMYMSAEKLAELDSLSGDVVVVSVRDHGAGIPVEEADKVFAAFVQLSISDKKDRAYQGGKHGVVGQSSGTGLGLNLVMKFMEKMNGHIWFRNCPVGGGVEFCFCLPVAEGAVAPNSDAENRVVYQTRLLPEQAVSIRVLVVDDSMINVKVLVRMLQKLGVRDVETAYSGPKALELLNGAKLSEHTHQMFHPNLILSDLQMPDMSGEELGVALRMLPLDPSPILMACTADWTSTVELRCKDAGFDGVLRKPMTYNELEEFLVRTVTGNPGLFIV